MIEFDFTFYGERLHATLARSTYLENGAPYVGVMLLPSTEDPAAEVEDFGDLTINIGPIAALSQNVPPCFAISGDLDGTGIPEVLEDAGILTILSEKVSSGFGTYRLARFEPGAFDSIPTADQLPAEIGRYLSHLKEGPFRMVMVRDLIESLGSGKGARPHEKRTVLTEILESGTRAVPEAWAGELFDWIEASNPEDLDAWQTKAPCGTWSPEDLDLSNPRVVEAALHSGLDLYNTQTGEFIFEFNDSGSIATTTVDLADPNLLACIADESFDLYEDIVGGLNYACYITDSNEALLESGDALPRPLDPAFDARHPEYERIAGEDGWGPASPSRIRSALKADRTAPGAVNLEELAKNVPVSTPDLAAGEPRINEEETR